MKTRDTLFKGCTRPPMIFGVPMVPFAVMVAAFILVATWINLVIMLGVIPIFIIMRVLTKKDDQQFRLLFLKAFFSMPALKNSGFWKASATTPLSFKRDKGIKLTRKDLK